MKKKIEKLVVFSGAGMSAESGLKTFRDHNGLWENYEVTEVATPEAWSKDPELVLRFYNARRNQLKTAKPNAAHGKVAQLESNFDVHVITQNIDNLHEQAGSSRVIHLHGELNKARSEGNPKLLYDLNYKEINWGDLCEEGHQLRPHVVWFGESVPEMDVALKVLIDADILIVIGTSLNVYPAAGLIHYVPENCQRFLIDPKSNEMDLSSDWTLIHSGASEGMALVFEKLMQKKGDSF